MKVRLALACTALGILLCAVFVAVVVMPAQRAESAKAVEKAFVRGTMVKISATKSRCEVWQLRGRQAVCE